MKNKKITFWELVMLNISALYGNSLDCQIHIGCVFGTGCDSDVGNIDVPVLRTAGTDVCGNGSILSARWRAGLLGEGGLRNQIRIPGVLDALDGLDFLVCILPHLLFGKCHLHGGTSGAGQQQIVGVGDVHRHHLDPVHRQHEGYGIRKVFHQRGISGIHGADGMPDCTELCGNRFLEEGAECFRIHRCDADAEAEHELPGSDFPALCLHTGAQLAANFISEMENPQKNYPRAICTRSGDYRVLYAIGSIAMTMLPTSEIQSSTGTLDALLRACELLGIPTLFVQVIALGIALSVLGALVLYIAQPTKMLFGFVEPGVFSERITKVNEHGIPTKAIVFQATLISVLLIGVSYLPGVEAIYNMLVTMTALTTLFPYVFLFLAYGKIKREKEDLDGLYVMTKNKKLASTVTYAVTALCVFAIICSALPIMGSTQENIIYEAELIGGSILIIVSGLLIWKKSGLENKVIPVRDVKQTVPESEPKPQGKSNYF